MKKGVLLSPIAIAFLFSMSLVAAEACELDITLINQNPYPAVPGDYVKLVFQIEGIDSPECNDITFELLEDYPVEFDPGESGLRVFRKVDYIKDYESNILVPYEVRVNEDALDGRNPIETNVQSAGDSVLSETFNLEVDDVRADFEIYVKSYNYNTKELTLEILNIEDSDIEALAVTIPKQENIDVKGPNTVIVGDLDSNEYTTADFEATVYDGEIYVNLIYSDLINKRRTATKTVSFDSSYFTNRISDQNTTSPIIYLIIIAIVLAIAYYFYRKWKKKKKSQAHKHK